MFPGSASSSILLVPPGQYFCIPLFLDASGCFLMFDFANLGLLLFLERILVIGHIMYGVWFCC